VGLPAGSGGGLRHPGDLLEVVPALGGGAGALVGQHQTTDTASTVGLLGGRAEHVVGQQHRAGEDVVQLGQFTGELEVQHVPAVVPEQVQHPASGVTCFRGRQDLLR